MKGKIHHSEDTIPS